MSREGGDNYFVSARDRDLGPLLDGARNELELDGERRAQLEAFLEAAWLAGTRSGHAKLLNEAIRQREEHSPAPTDDSTEPVQTEVLEAEFKAMMEKAAEVLSLPAIGTVALWDLLTRAWTAGVKTYESEVMASLIERNADLVGEVERWLQEGGTEPSGD